MPDTEPQQPTYRFGVFELDICRGELRKHGVRIRLQQQPLQILKLLLERPGEVVAREDIQKRLWADMEKLRAEYERVIHTELRLIRQRLQSMPPAAPSSAVPAPAAAPPVPALDYSRFAERFRGPEDEYYGGWRTFPMTWGEAPQERLRSQEALALMRNALDALPSAQQRVVVLRDVHGCDTAQVSELLGISEAIQRALLHHGRASLRQALASFLTGE